VKPLDRLSHSRQDDQAIVAALEAQLVPANRMPVAFYCHPFFNWLRAALERSPATINSYEDALNKFVAFCEAAGIQAPDDVRPKIVQRYLAFLRQARGLSVSTVNHHRHALATFYRFLIQEEVTTFNPAAASIGLKPARRLPDYLTPTEQRWVLETLAQGRRRRAQRDFAVVALMMLCGLRASELCNLRVSHLDLDTGVLRVVEGKGRKDRLVPIIPWLAAVLRWYFAEVRPAFVKAPDVDHVFPNRAGAGAMARPALWGLIRRVVSPIIGRPAHPHMLRHTFASRAIEGGGNLVALQMAMGHDSPSTTMIYSHIPDPEYRAKLAGWLAAGLDEITGPWSRAPEANTPAPAVEAPGVDDEVDESPAAWSFRRAASDPAVRARLRQLRRSRRRR
jgi:site-specific recombinase XerD